MASKTQLIVRIQCRNTIGRSSYSQGQGRGEYHRQSCGEGQLREGSRSPVFLQCQGAGLCVEKSCCYAHSWVIRMASSLRQSRAFTRLHWTGDNIQLTRQLFCESGLYREKTERQTGDTTYLDMTIHNALRKRRNPP